MGFYNENGEPYESSNSPGGRYYYRRDPQPNRGGQYSAICHANRMKIVGSVQDGDVENLIHKIYDDAMDGKASAQKIYFEYIAGRPTQAIELSGPEGEPLRFSAERLDEELRAAAKGDDEKYHELTSAFLRAVRSVGSKGPTNPQTSVMKGSPGTSPL
jgi:hypothetical protein